MSPVDDVLEEYCPECGKYVGGDSICPYCDHEIFNESGIEESEEESEEGPEDLQ